MKRRELYVKGPSVHEELSCGSVGSVSHAAGAAPGRSLPRPPHRPDVPGCCRSGAHDRDGTRTVLPTGDEPRALLPPAGPRAAFGPPPPPGSTRTRPRWRAAGRVGPWGVDPGARAPAHALMPADERPRRDRARPASVQRPSQPWRRTARKFPNQSRGNTTDPHVKRSHGWRSSPPTGPEPGNEVRMPETGLCNLII